MKKCACVTTIFVCGPNVFGGNKSCNIFCIMREERNAFHEPRTRTDPCIGDYSCGCERLEAAHNLFGKSVSFLLRDTQ